MKNGSKRTLSPLGTFPSQYQITPSKDMYLYVFDHSCRGYTGCISRFGRNSPRVEAKVLPIEKRVKNLKPLTKMIQRNFLELFPAKTRYWM